MDSWDIRSRLERLVFTQLRDEHGDAAITREPLISQFTGHNFGDHDVPVDYLQAVEVAENFIDIARGLVTEYVNKARGHGCSWVEIAATLKIDPDEVDDSAIEAFERVALLNGYSWRADAYTRWTCTSCGQRVNDRGPWNGHPADNESGHAEDCERHQREIRAYMLDATDVEDYEPGDNDTTDYGRGGGWE
ncbi:hypothetical protein KO481_33540 [Nocardia sp. NEAU-G5]|uniref:Uncharacterized protein n=1 Tax=Nocardia albiluteola TaxID=2842303 RepID=A0ABS6BB40_9NOCA|nr:hypothetical protein [Nocardia albiluteola]MBU3066433.1 hypothetical protein [Nocardia albiluteola]